MRVQRFLDAKTELNWRKPEKALKELLGERENNSKSLRLHNRHLFGKPDTYWEQKQTMKVQLSINSKITWKYVTIIPNKKKKVLHKNVFSAWKASITFHQTGRFFRFTDRLHPDHKSPLVLCVKFLASHIICNFSQSGPSCWPFVHTTSNNATEMLGEKFYIESNWTDICIMKLLNSTQQCGCEYMRNMKFSLLFFPILIALFWIQYVAVRRLKKN